uniref:Uncharacterized protein n=1 Tax=Picea sitchensis TaxID=3332 RepID=D5ACZ1_PICSI|nr:unknown [Picea sitchensis]
MVAATVLRRTMDDVFAQRCSRHFTARDQLISKESRNLGWVCDITEEEDELIIRMYKLVGNRWSLIAGRLPGRKAEEIERYWKMRSINTAPLKPIPSRITINPWLQTHIAPEETACSYNTVYTQNLHSEEEEEEGEESRVEDTRKSTDYMLVRPVSPVLKASCRCS